MTNKLITIITAIYNASSTIERSILSVVKQKAEDIEYIIVDGLSTDGSIDIINKYSKFIDVVISEPDKGVYDAWNKALNYAHGEWIVFLGADDFYELGTFNKYKELIRSSDTKNIDIISARCRLINSNGDTLRVFGNAYNWNTFRHGTNCLSHGTTLHNRKLFLEVGTYDLRFDVNADFELLLRRKLKALFIDEIVLNMQDGGISYSAKGIIQSYKIKRYHRTGDIMHDLYYLIKGLLGFYCRRMLWNVTKK